MLSDKLVFRPRLTPVAGRVSRCGDELARTALYEASRAREIVTPPSAEAGRSYGTESGQGEVIKIKASNKVAFWVAKERKEVA